MQDKEMIQGIIKTGINAGQKVDNVTITLNIDLSRDTGDEASDFAVDLPDGGVDIEVEVQPTDSQFKLALGVAKDAFVASLKEQGVVIDDVTFFS